MDLETENRLAALLMEEARRLRAEAEKEGVHAYLRQPNVRGRPNSRFLTATVLGVEQANRAVEVNEMWRAREKEMELDMKLKNRARNNDIHNNERSRGNSRKRVSSSSRHDEEDCTSSALRSASKLGHGAHACYSSEDGGLRDDEVEEFLLSRAKRGRGAIGSRMDEPGPYPSIDSDAGKTLVHPETREKEEWEHRILGPEKPSYIKLQESSDDEVHYTGISRKKRCSKEKRKKRSREERSERKKSREKKKSQHRRHKSRSRSDSD
ncbi:arginine/serine-rich coiled-coil protein 2-like [Asparagus officinalis]|nr:arginine/serine-rich coiled-coil protein 2-like [Asparagus officinalis]